MPSSVRRRRIRPVLSKKAATSVDDSNTDNLTRNQDETRDQGSDGVPLESIRSAQPLTQIGRYRVQKVLGRGGFGLVYLAHDEQLDRLVAIKVPHAKLISGPEDADAYLTEARTVANLDHPGIVPVYDIGCTEECPCYIVSKYIEGTDLSAKTNRRRLKYREAAELTAAVAESLHYAHKQGLVHRDVKPGNILIDQNGQPFVVDFGLALQEENIGKGPKYAGTPAYMSPEQARGEGHRVDGRSDVFSLGLVFYELLSGRKPFRADTRAELLEQVTSYEPRPLRQYDERLPKELARICHKAMAKRASERYLSAHDMAADLRLFLQEQTAIQSGTSPGGGMPLNSVDQDSTQASTFPGSVSASLASTIPGSSNSQPIRIVPKGLRSFDAHDADFFLELLPGPKDRDGLPDSLRFWKSRLEETDPANTFSAGLIYGPSGCGKSSLVKAGLLPLLSEGVIPVYVEATPEETESRLLNGLRKRCPTLDENLSLKGTLAALRRGQGISVGTKVLIVLDQFEQWLHDRNEEESTELVQALRQCDGGRVQCIVLVRDDFWMAVTRLGMELEVDFVPGDNMTPVDLFPIRHARKVLTAFGRAFGALPDEIAETSREQKDFINQAVAGLAKEGKVICVRLALFAEMMKGKAWTLASLKQVGGTEGVGVTFLEETFTAQTAVPRHRLHQKAARSVLKELLPDHGMDIRGYMRSHAELLEASGYRNSPKDFDGLLRILDSELRLITPTDPEGQYSDVDSVTRTDSSQKYFQLTHDYLVHSLRDWLTRKQKETRKGRAELKLFETSVTWNARPENRFLSSWWEHLTILMLTDRQKWTDPQREMMSKANRVHGLRTIMAASLVMAASFIGLGIRNSVIDSQNLTRAESLVDSVSNADIAQVPAVISTLNEYRQWADPLLKARISRAEEGSAEKLQLALALLPVDDGQIGYLRDQLLVCSLTQLPVLRAALQPYKDKLTDTLWSVATDDEQEAAIRFQAATALAEYAPDDERWEAISSFVAEYLTSTVSPVYLGSWRELLRPANEQLAIPLTAIHANHDLSENPRAAAAYALSDYLRDQPDKLMDVILVADEFAGFTFLSAAMTPHAATVLQRLLSEMQAAMPAGLDKTNDELSQADQQLRDAHWERQSLAAVTLVHLGHGDDVWTLLELTAEPSLRSFVIHHLGALGTNHNTLAARLKVESEVSVRRALIQSLGGLNAATFPASDRNRITEQLKSLYTTDPDSGIHSSALWTLRQWGAVLPELAVGIPSVSEKQSARIKKRAAEVEDIRQRMITDEQNELPVRQATWERRLQRQPVQSSDSISDGLIAHYPLDESEGTETANLIEGQPAGSYRGSGQPDWVPGVVGNAIRLDGLGAHLSCGQVFNPERTDAFSYGCWILNENENRYATVLSKMDSEKNLRGFDLFLVPEGHFEIHFKHHFPDNFLKVISVDPLPTGEWHHVAMVYDGSSTAAGTTLYIDGRPIDTKSVTETLSGTIQNNVPLRLGQRDAQYPFRGAIDDMRIYNRRLSDNEVQELYTMGLRALAGVTAETRTTEQQALLSATYYPQDELSQRIQSELVASQRALREARTDGIRRWYVNGQQQTMLVLPAHDEFADGQINHSFAIASHEVTVAEFRRFRARHNVNELTNPTEDCPVHLVSWYEAAAYCNWLSKQEGIPEDQWVYVPNEQGQYGDGMLIRENALELTGYRLPTDAEWEHAGRAGCSGTYGFGEPLSLLKHYARYDRSSSSRSHPVESLLPNPVGLFDVHGNVWEWTQTPSSGAISPVSDDGARLLRGGSFLYSSLNVQFSNRTSLNPTYNDFYGGFRPARTHRLSP